MKATITQPNSAITQNEWTVYGVTYPDSTNADGTNLQSTTVTRSIDDPTGESAIETLRNECARLESELNNIRERFTELEKQNTTLIQEAATVDARIAKIHETNNRASDLIDRMSNVITNLSISLCTATGQKFLLAGL